MTCDRCHRIILEDNTYERILCYGCSVSEPLPPHHHCAVCGVKILYSRFTANVKWLFDTLRPYKIYAAIVLMVIFSALVIQVPIITKFVMGVVCIALAIVAVLLAVALLFPGILYLGEWIVKRFDWNIRDEVGTWFIGLLSLTSPVILYLVYLCGSIVLKHFFGMS